MKTNTVVPVATNLLIIPALAFAGYLALLSPAAAGLIVVQPGPYDGKDTYIDNRPYVTGGVISADHNMGDFQTVRIGHADGSNSFVEKGLVQFDVASLPATGVVSAKLMLWMCSWGAPNTSTAITAYQISGHWDENSITWNNSTSLATTDIGASTFVDETLGYRWIEWDVTTAYNAWKADTSSNDGLLLVPGLNLSGETFSFFSSDYNDDPSLRPKLVVEAVPEPSNAIVGAIAIFCVVCQRRRKTASA